jgi:phage shock protein E
MMELLKKLFGAGAKVNYAGLIKQGAVIVDVRTQDEYKSGHIKGAINIPLGNLKIIYPNSKKINVLLPVVRQA